MMKVGEIWKYKKHVIHNLESGIKKLEKEIKERGYGARAAHIRIRITALEDECVEVESLDIPNMQGEMFARYIINNFLKCYEKERDEDR